MLIAVYHALPFTDEYVHLFAETKFLISYLAYLSYVSISQ